MVRSIYAGGISRQQKQARDFSYNMCLMIGYRVKIGHYIRSTIIGYFCHIPHQYRQKSGLDRISRPRISSVVPAVANAISLRPRPNVLALSQERLVQRYSHSHWSYHGKRRPTCTHIRAITVKITVASRLFAAVGYAVYL